MKRNVLLKQRYLIIVGGWRGGGNYKRIRQGTTCNKTHEMCCKWWSKGKQTREDETDDVEKS